MSAVHVGFDAVLLLAFLGFLYLLFVVNLGRHLRANQRNYPTAPVRRHARDWDWRA